MTEAEEVELALVGIWTPTGSVTPREYLASRPAADQVKARLHLLLAHPERYRLLARAFAEYLDLDLDALYAERHPRRGALTANHRAPGEHPNLAVSTRSPSAPPPIQGEPPAMEDHPARADRGEHTAEAAGEHPDSPARGERHRAVLTPPVAAMLRAARSRCGWSVRQAAGHLHLAVGMISMMESGSRAPSRQVAERLVDVYQLDEVEAAQLLREAVPTR